MRLNRDNQLMHHDGAKGILALEVCLQDKFKYATASFQRTLINYKMLFYNDIFSI